MKTLAYVVIGNGPDVAVHAKDFLDQNNRAARGRGAFGKVRAKFVAVRCFQFYLCTHRLLISNPCRVGGYSVVANDVSVLPDRFVSLGRRFVSAICPSHPEPEP